MEEGKESKNLTARSVLDCVTEFDDWSGKEVFFNNLFLFLSLIIISIRTWDSCNRAIRADRLGKDVKINKKDLEDPEIGFIQTYFTKKGVVCVSWNDDGPVLNVSNVQGSRLLTTVKCSSPEVRDHRNIERPNRISFYNKTWEVETRWILLSAITTLASVAKSGVDQILSTQLMSSKVQHSE